MGKEDSPVRMRLNDLVQVVMAQGKASALSAEVQKKQLMANRNIERLIVVPRTSQNQVQAFRLIHKDPRSRACEGGATFAMRRLGSLCWVLISSIRPANLKLSL